jgi:uncharacterized protein
MAFRIKDLGFLLLRMAGGIALVIGAVMLTESAGRWLLDKTGMPEDLENLVISLMESALALFLYIIFFRYTEKREITELNKGLFIPMAFEGFTAGFILQALIIFVIYFSGHYHIEYINPLRNLLPGLGMALAAGFVAELILRGILFRLLEEKLGTTLTLIFLVILFAILHAGAPGASLITVGATAIHAGLLLSAAYVVSRSLWFPIFLHFAYDFAEPAFFGGVNPGIRLDHTFITAKISGAPWISGGVAGPQNSLIGLVLGLLVSGIFLWWAGKKNRFMKPSWLQ